MIVALVIGPLAFEVELALVHVELTVDGTPSEAETQHASEVATVAEAETQHASEVATVAKRECQVDTDWLSLASRIDTP